MKVPNTEQYRDHLRARIANFVRDRGYQWAMTTDQLRALAEEFIDSEKLEEELRDWTMVYINNAIWRKQVASTPPSKRILMLPQCLRNQEVCTADIDQYGLLCHQCNSCSINRLQDIAYKHNTMSIVAEGFTSIVGLVESGQIEAVIGVGCLDSLERAFELMVNNAVPGIAIPLNCSGCKNTEVDCHAVIEALEEIRPFRARLVAMDQVKGWFLSDSLMGQPSGQAMSLAHEIMRTDGKRWRPFLMASVYSALTGNDQISDDVARAAIAIEYFHKASLVHDDIEDSDQFRYNTPTLHDRFGVPIAINVGDAMVGEGYRILSEIGSIELIKVASKAHLALCQGQGMELEWNATQGQLSMDQVIEIFRLKTSPAFSAALEFGAILASADEDQIAVLRQYSDLLGVAYQLKDDLQDFTFKVEPSAIYAAILESNPTIDIQELTSDSEILKIAMERIQVLYSDYRTQTITSLKGIKNLELRRFLLRAANRILD